MKNTVANWENLKVNHMTKQKYTKINEKKIIIPLFLFCQLRVNKIYNII